MTTKRTGTPWMAADAYGKTLAGLSLNLIVRDVAASVPFYRDVIGMTVHYADEDMARYDRRDGKPREKPRWKDALPGAESWTWNHYVKLLETENIGLPDDLGSE